MTPKVSIIIPVYNVEEYLKTCLNSAINQTLNDIEIICINSGTEDNSAVILEEYAKNDTRIRIITLEENLGQGVARNIAIDQALGNYIMFLDADDWLELDACEIAYNKISQEKCDFVKFAYNTYDEKTKNITLNCSAVNILLQNSNSDIRKTNIDFFKACYSCTQIYDRQFLIQNEIKYANLRVCEDVPFVTKACVKARKFCALQNSLYNYRINRFQNTTNNTRFWKDIFTARKIALDIIKESAYSNLQYSTYFPYCIRTIVNYYTRMTKIDNKIKKNFYNEMRNFFIDISQLSKVKRINSKYEQYKFYLKVLKYNYFLFVFTKRFNSLLEAIKND